MGWMWIKLFYMWCNDLCSIMVTIMGKISEIITNPIKFYILMIVLYLIKKKDKRKKKLLKDIYLIVKR
jgi:hypothetical protein